MYKTVDSICAFAVVILVICSAFVMGIKLGTNTVERKDQEIAELNQTIGEYRINEAWFEDYIDLLEEIYEGKINEAVLEERVKQLENAKNGNLSSNIYDDYVYQLLEDFDDSIEIIIYYYENTDQVVDLVTYIATNYPALYQRLLSYN